MPKLLAYRARQNADEAEASAAGTWVGYQDGRAFFENIFGQEGNAAADRRFAAEMGLLVFRICIRP
jgi:hypothetical protein